MVKGKRAVREAVEAENEGKMTDSTSTKPIAVSSEPPDKLRRLSIPISENGLPSWDNMRLTSKDELIQVLRAALTDKDTVNRLGLGDTPKLEIFDATWTGSIYDALGAIESYLAQKMYGISPKIARDCFTFTEIEKEKLAKPTAALINKWALKYDWLIKFKEEIAVAMLLVAISSVKLKMAQMMQAAENQAKTIAPKPNGADHSAETVTA